MHADVKGALAQIDTSWKAFVHRGLPMTEQQVRDVLEYAVKKGYKTTGELSEHEVDEIIEPKIDISK